MMGSSTDSQNITLTHVRAAPVAGSLTGLPVVFTHIPKAGGTTFDHIVSAIADHAGEGFRRVTGTLYGQFLRGGAGGSLDSLRALAKPPFTQVRYLTGHLPFLPPEDFGVAEAAYTTLLRDPVARTLSHFRYGLGRGGWHADAAIDDLIATGKVCDNPQTRQLAGCLDRAEPCDDVMLVRAKQTLERHYALVGLTDEFDGFLGALVGLLGWPEVIYGKA